MSCSWKMHILLPWPLPHAFLKALCRNSKAVFVWMQSFKNKSEAKCPFLDRWWGKNKMMKKRKHADNNELLFWGEKRGNKLNLKYSSNFAFSHNKHCHFITVAPKTNHWNLQHKHLKVTRCKYNHCFTLYIVTVGQMLGYTVLQTVSIWNHNNILK